MHIEVMFWKFSAYSLMVEFCGRDQVLEMTICHSQGHELKVWYQGLRSCLLVGEVKIHTEVEPGPDPTYQILGCALSKPM